MTDDRCDWLTLAVFAVAALVAAVLALAWESPAVEWGWLNGSGPE
jgi:hypothetical protein